MEVWQWILIAVAAVIVLGYIKWKVYSRMKEKKAEKKDIE